MSDPLADIPLVTPLTAQKLRQAGVPEGWNFGQMDRVRFHELDALNHVNNITYLRWFEDIRIPYFHAYAVTSYDGRDDPQVVLATNFARYFKPMFLGETYVIAARATSFRNSSFVLEYGIFVDGELRCGGETVIVTLEQDGKTKRVLSSEVIAALTADGASKAG
ncbi:acyl-CoA thioester hydrolase [Aliiroseovarius halocynthiae]|uniref:Acyl-CoA thioesterase n=1 Tax=Aliiroseovarius halocynthiae TaxID=985055 RepID=A0A545SVS4_9RHOB|nr:thioesterase family protein [Aliiroseovarius halocynthiae]TQV69063.1 acyl-CoA thioesterase [Aliiroseovarius halocynthiae]SMR71816.1 acyl-CoA thioester hydrolase [Aliiroseovarius halocynthiae]